MMPFERRGSDRNRESHGRGARGGVDPALLPSVEPRQAPAKRRALWLFVPIAVLLVVLGLQAARLEPIAVLQIAFAALFAVGVGWIVFALASPRPERVICPACTRTELANVDGGVRCRACGWDGRELARREADAMTFDADDPANDVAGDVVGDVRGDVTDNLARDFVDEFDVDELARRLRGRGTLGDPPHRC
ncbi:MAG: hypothetical protein HZA52_05435 [Planctomycetes bacterium]|nr:hypothetical protein [Planctomycetota bacterium]